MPDLSIFPKPLQILVWILFFIISVIEIPLKRDFPSVELDQTFDRIELENKLNKKQFVLKESFRHYLEEKYSLKNISLQENQIFYVLSWTRKNKYKMILRLYILILYRHWSCLIYLIYYSSTFLFFINFFIFMDKIHFPKD